MAIASAKLDNEFLAVQRAAGRSFLTMFHGLELLWKKGTETANRHHGTVTYSLICAFRTLVLTIGSTSERHTQQRVPEPVAPSSKDKKDSSKTSKAKRTDRAMVPDALSTLLKEVLLHLEPSQSGPHTSLFEGILYTLLERTADRLYLLTFRHARAETTEEDIVRLAQVLESDKALEKRTGDLDFRSANTEVVFLVRLLEGAMKLAPKFLGSLLPTVSTKSSRTSSTQATRLTNLKPSLSVAAKEKLQRTLIQCMFGGDERRKADPDADTENEDEESANDFVEVLRKPFLIGPPPMLPRLDDVDTPQWFTEEIWKLVGWDILSRDVAW